MRAIGKSGRLGRERRRPRHARIHLDDEHFAVARIHGELDVAAARVDADLANDRDGRVAHHLILAIGERHRRRDGDRVAGVHAHRIEILDRADDDDVVLVVAHHLELELLPADHAALDEHLVRRREIEPVAHDLLELVAVVGDAAARAAERERRTDDRGKSGDVENRFGFVEALGDAARRRRRDRCDASLRRTACDLRRSRSRRAVAPINSTPYFSSAPDCDSAIETLSAVWPPIVGRIASGRSFSRISSTNSGVTGSMYVRSANSGSVMIVAGFELIRMTS